MSQTIETMQRVPDRDLARLLDRAAGALGQSHPGLAAELSARADREHEPPDPFDGFIGDAQVDWFRSFGYLVLPGSSNRHWSRSCVTRSSARCSPSTATGITSARP